jgi:integrase
MAKRRGNGEASVYQRKSDGRWLAAVTLGYDATGRQIRKSVTTKTRGEVVQKLKQLQRLLDDGLPTPDNSVTVRNLLDRWHQDVLRHQVARSAAENYKSIADRHIAPALGRKRLTQLTPADVDRLMSQRPDPPHFLQGAAGERSRSLRS